MNFHRNTIAECIWVHRNMLHILSEPSFRCTPTDIPMEIRDTRKSGHFKWAGKLWVICFRDAPTWVTYTGLSSPKFWYKVYYVVNCIRRSAEMTIGSRYMLQSDGTYDSCFDGLMDRLMGFRPIPLGFWGSYVT